MANIKFPLENATDVFSGIEKVYQEKVDPRAPSTKSHLPENPGTFYTKMTYQRKHNQYKLWMNRKKVENAHKIFKAATHGAKFASSLPTTAELSLPQSIPSEDSQTEVKKTSISRPLIPDIENKIKADNEPIRPYPDPKSISVSEETITEISWVSESEEEEPQIPENLKTYSKYQLYYNDVNNGIGADSIRTVHRQIDTYHLDLRYIRISYIELKAICLTAMMCPMITRLDLTEVHIDDTKTLYLIELFKDNHFITDLILKSCRLGYRQIKRLIKTLRDRDNLVYLDVSDNNLKDDSAILLAKYIDEATALQYLSVAMNAFGELTGKYFGIALGYNHYLRYLDISKNTFRGESGRFLLNGIARNDTLETIDLSWNTFRESGAGIIRRILESSELRSIDITGTGMNSVCMEHIITGLRTNTSLEYIGLRNNPFLVEDYTGMLEAVNKNEESKLIMIDLGNQTLSKRAINIAKHLYSNRLVDVLHGAQVESDGFLLGGKVSLMKINMACSVLSKLKSEKRIAIANYFKLVDQNQIEAAKPQHYKEIESDCTFNAQAERGVISFRSFALRLLMAGDNPERTIEEAEKQIGALALGPLPYLNIIKSEPDIFAIRDVELKTRFRSDMEDFASTVAKQPGVVQFE